MILPWDHVVFWHWLALGAVLMVLEVLAPGVIFLWLGIAAIAVGIILFVVPGFGWEVQLIVFAVVAVFTTLAGRRLAGARQPRDDEPDPADPGLNRRAERYIGRTFVLEDTTLNGRGKIGIGDSLWQVVVEPAGTELFQGARVVVVGVDGATLIVEAAGGREPTGPPD
jgi:membrane protein implicated in regulation of membrane protease activity